MIACGNLEFRMIKETLAAQSVEERLAHGFVVGLGVAYIGEYLCQRLLVVNADKVLVLRQAFLGAVVAVDGFGGIVLVGVLMDESFLIKAIGQWGLFSRPTYSKRGNGHDQTGQMEHVDDELGLVNSSAQEAVAQPFLIHEAAEGLRVEERIGSGIDEREEIVIARLGLTAASPSGGAVEVGTNGKHHRGLCHHRLVEVGRSQLLLDVGRASDNNAVQLQIAHSLRATSFIEESVQQMLIDRL